MQPRAVLFVDEIDLAAFDEFFGSRKAKPTDDLTSALVNAELEGEKLDDAELGSFFVLLVVAGNETTRNAISHALVALSEHPAERKIWQSDFRAVGPTAVEELQPPPPHGRSPADADSALVECLAVAREERRIGFCDLLGQAKRPPLEIDERLLQRRLRQATPDGRPNDEP